MATRAKSSRTAGRNTKGRATTARTGASTRHGPGRAQAKRSKVSGAGGRGVSVRSRRELPLVGKESPVDAEAAVVARRLFAMSDPTRLAIVALVASGERCVCELTESLGAAQSRLSFHLRTLKDAGVVRDERRGRWIYYSLEPGVLREVAEAMGAIERGDWIPDSGGCCGPSCCGG